MEYLLGRLIGLGLCGGFPGESWAGAAVHGSSGCSSLINASELSVRRREGTGCRGSSLFPEALAFLQVSIFRAASEDREERIWGQIE